MKTPLKTLLPFLLLGVGVSTISWVDAESTLTWKTSDFEGAWYALLYSRGKSGQTAPYTFTRCLVPATGDRGIYTLQAPTSAGGGAGGAGGAQGGQPAAPTCPTSQGSAPVNPNYTSEMTVGIDKRGRVLQKGGVLGTSLDIRGGLFHLDATTGLIDRENGEATADHSYILVRNSETLRQSAYLIQGFMAQGKNNMAWNVVSEQDQIDILNDNIPVSGANTFLGAVSKTSNDPNSAKKSGGGACFIAR